MALTLSLTPKKLEKTPTIKGGELISRMLAAEGVEKVFGIIDGTYFGLYSTMGDNGIELVTPRHESCAAHMAGAYARMTGSLGVCLASNGPGVANILPGIAVENAEGNRVLVITSSRRASIIYPDRGGTFQCFPHVEVTRPMTKWACAVGSVDRLAEVMRKALRHCFEGRPGVVHVDVPEDIMNGSYELDSTWLREPGQYRSMAALHPAPGQIDAAVEMLRQAERPVIHAGSGVLHADAMTQVARLAELLGAPLTTSWAARAAVDERRPEAIPMVYIDAVNKARTEADLVLVLGSRTGETDWWGKAPYWGTPETQAWIQVDIDAEVLANLRPVELPVRCDVKVFLDLLIERLETAPRSVPQRRVKFLDKLNKMVAKRRAKLDKHLTKETLPMHPAQVPHILQAISDDDSILVVDGGNTSIWAHFFSEIRTHNTLLATPKMGMLGAGVSQALAAQLAHPDRQVTCIIGDGAMGFHPQEIETAVRNELPVLYLVLCDKQWGMVKMNQQFMLKPIKTIIQKSLGPDETMNGDLNEIEFDVLARSMGAYGERVADHRGLADAIARARSTGRCAVIHVDVDPVQHMWAPELKTFKDMHQEPAG